MPISGPRRHRRADLVAAVLLTLAHLAYILAIQSRIAVMGGLGWDGVTYYRMAKGKLSDGVYPYAERIGVPFVARYLPFPDLILNFEVLNLVFACGFSVLAFLLVAQVKDDLSLFTKITGWALLCMTQLSPIGFTVWYPVHNDSVGNALLLVFLYLLLARVTAPLVYGVLFFCATIVRENFPLFAVMVLLVCRFEPPTWPAGAWFLRQLRAHRSVLLLLVAAAVGAALALFIAVQVAPYNPFEIKGGWFVRYLSERPLVATGAAIVNVYGPAFVFYLLYRGQARVEEMLEDPLWKRRWYYLVPVIVTTVVAIGGGGNVERYLFWALPLIVLYVTPRIDVLIKRRRYGLWAFGVAFMLLFQRALIPIDRRGLADCDLRSIVTGTSTWLGHWVQTCSNYDAFRLLQLYVSVCLLALVLSLVSASWRAAGVSAGPPRAM